MIEHPDSVSRVPRGAAIGPHVVHSCLAPMHDLTRRLRSSTSLNSSRAATAKAAMFSTRSSIPVNTWRVASIGPATATQL